MSPTRFQPDKGKWRSHLERHKVWRNTYVLTYLHTYLLTYYIRTYVFNECRNHYHLQDATCCATVILKLTQSAHLSTILTILQCESISRNQLSYAAYVAMWGVLQWGCGRSGRERCFIWGNKVRPGVRQVFYCHFFGLFCLFWRTNEHIIKQTFADVVVFAFPCGGRE